jgi:uncharacterized protein YndB with AHSA1/START domain
VKSDDFVRVTTRVAVDAETAFEIFTREIDAWWRQGPRFRADFQRKSVMRFEPGVGGRLLQVYDEAGAEPVEFGRVRVWEPGTRLVFDWRNTNFAPGQVTEVEVRFEPDAGGTRVTLEHRGWECIPPGHPARHGLEADAFRALIGSFWSDLLLSARAHAARGRGER